MDPQNLIRWRSLIDEVVVQVWLVCKKGIKRYRVNKVWGTAGRTAGRQDGRLVNATTYKPPAEAS